MNIYIVIRSRGNEKELAVEIEGINKYGDTETDKSWITKEMLLEVLNSGENK